MGTKPAGARHANANAMSRPPFAARPPALSYSLRRAPEQVPTRPARIPCAEPDDIPLFDITTVIMRVPAEDAADAADSRDLKQTLSRKTLSPFCNLFGGWGRGGAGAEDGDFGILKRKTRLFCLCIP